MGVVGRHVESPEVFLDLEAWGVRGYQEGGDTTTVTRLTRGTREYQVGVGDVHPGVPGLLAVDHPVRPIPDRTGFHVGGIGPVFGFGDAECEHLGAAGEPLHPLGLLLRRAVLQHEQQPHVVSDDGVLVLQVTVQSQATPCQVFANDGHAQVGSIPSAEFRGKGIPKVARRVGTPAGLAEQRLPFSVGQTATLPIGSRIFSPVVEESDVVIGLLERHDLTVDESVELCQIIDELGRQFEVHLVPSRSDGLVNISKSHSISGIRRPLAAITMSRTLPSR